MISAAQLRAARGLLDWTRSELAKASGLSPETIKNIEHGIYTPQEATIKAIIDTFNLHDVEFSEADGVRRSFNTVVNYEGKDDFRRYVDDIYQILLQNPDDREICVLGNNDQNFVDTLGDYAKVHIDRMTKLPNLKFRALCVESVDVFVTKYIDYRSLPNISFAIPFSVYVNRFDFVLYGEGSRYPKVVAIKSETVAQAYKAQFNEIWKLSKPISVSK